MRIKEVSCQWFAGVRNRHIALEPGINVVYGPNESGKSTMVNLISGTLFQNAKLSNRDSRDKTFRARFFPGTKRGKTTEVDTIDGEIVLEADGETYTLRKRWGEDPSCTLSFSDGLIRNPDAISARLKEVLCYGEGVYTELLLSPRSDAGKTLESILNNASRSDARTEILDVLSQTFAESDGVSLDAIEAAMKKEINDIAGKHWDESRDEPERKAGGGRWSRDVGSVMAAYYEWKDAETRQKELEEKETALEQAELRYREQNGRYLLAKKELENFQRIANRLSLREAKKQQLDDLREKLQKRKADFTAWPQTEMALERGRTLQTEKLQREALDRYQAVLEIQKELETVDQSILERPCPDDAEINSVQSALRKISKLENQLCGMNLTAEMELFGAHPVEIRSVRTGELLPTEGGKASLTEAVTITVPDVMRMVLAPANVNVAETEENLRRLSEEIEESFRRYGVDSLEALRKYADDYRKTQNRVYEIRRRLEEKLAGRKLEDLEAGVVTTVRARAEIDEDAARLCGPTPLDVFALLKKEKLETLEKEYESISALDGQKKALETRITQLLAQEEETIPEEYLSVRDPQAHLSSLQEAQDRWQELRDAALKARAAAMTEWNSAQESQTEDIWQQVQEARRRFDEKRELLRHWRHIQRVFEEEKDAIQTDPTALLAESFARYLSLISGGYMDGTLPEAGKLELAVYSGDWLMDFGKLSEGTKDTVSLAYRLAVLDQLFPEGGGVIVLDDSFAEMDAGRTMQSVALVRECAKRHQVIFLTCKEELARQLEGNLIRL